MDNKTFGIGVLTLTGAALLIANLFAPAPVTGAESVANDDLQAVTARTVQGGEALYLLDRSSGRLAVFTADRQGMSIRAVEDVEKAFQKSAVRGRGRGD